MPKESGGIWRHKSSSTSGDRKARQGIPEIIKIPQNGYLCQQKVPRKIKGVQDIAKPVIIPQWFYFVESEKSCNSTSSKGRYTQRNAYGPSKHSADERKARETV